MKSTMMTIAAVLTAGGLAEARRGLGGTRNRESGRSFYKDSDLVSALGHWESNVTVPASFTLPDWKSYAEARLNLEPGFFDDPQIDRVFWGWELIGDLVETAPEAYRMKLWEEAALWESNQDDEPWEPSWGYGQYPALMQQLQRKHG